MPGRAADTPLVSALELFGATLHVVEIEIERIRARRPIGPRIGRFRRLGDRAAIAIDRLVTIDARTGFQDHHLRARERQPGTDERTGDPGADDHDVVGLPGRRWLVLRQSSSHYTLLDGASSYYDCPGGGSAQTPNARQTLGA